MTGHSHAFQSTFRSRRRPAAAGSRGQVGDHELLALGAQLEVLQRRAVGQQAGLNGTGWAKWNEAVVASVALAERIGRMPAHDTAGFAIKLRAICCEWEDDLEEHQLRRLRDLVREMERVG